MARINRSDVIQKAVNDLAISVSDSIVPSETLDKVQCTYSLNKQFSSFVASSSSTATGTLTIFTASTDLRTDTYLTNVQVSFAKDAICDVATGVLAINCTPFDIGITKAIGNIAVLTLTADAQTLNISLPYPLKIKPGTTVQFSGSFTVGAMSKGGSVTYFQTTSN